jgi:predicted short-subunit dehydrogenase-like oxidoreductase (DUF2520 family)
MRELERDFPIAAAPERGRGRAPAGTMPSLAIIGAGRVGGSIAAAAEAAGLDVRLAGRDEALDAAGHAEAALLCVPDSELPAAAEAVAAAVPPLRYVGHVSGASPLDVLEACARRGASTFSVHPLQTIPDPSTDLTGAPCAIAALNPGAARLAAELAGRLGMRPFEVAEEHRAAYHAAAVIASNFLVTLEESAARLLGTAGVPQARELLAPLVLRTAANWAERGAAALTGPIARGDAATVERHTEAIRELAPELLALYGVLAARTAAVAAGEEADE